MDDLTNIINALIQQDGKVLLLYNKKYRDYTLPGGKRDEGDDSLEISFYRENFEELGIMPMLLYKIGEYPFQTGDRRFVRHVYEAVITKGEPVIMESDVTGEIKNATLEEALALPLAPGIRDALIDYQNRSKPIEKILESSPNISLEEAEKMFKDVETGFATFYWRHFIYAGMPDDRKIGKEPSREVGLYFDALNHLAMARAVQEQILQSDNYEGTLHSQISLLTIEIFRFLSMFKGTGIGIYECV